MYSLCFRRPSKSAERRLQQRTRCLVVDDDPVCRTLLVAQLRTLGLDATAAATPREALRLMRIHRPSIVLIDICLSDGANDGYRLARHIRRQDHKKRHRPLSSGSMPPLLLVALSARAGHEHRHRCLMAGMDRTIEKPAALPTLAWALGLQPSPSAHVPPAAVSAVLHGLYRDACLRDLAALKLAVRRQDRERALAYAHRIRGASQVVGAHAVAGIAAVFERAGNDHQVDTALQARALGWLDRLLCSPPSPEQAGRS